MVSFVLLGDYGRLGNQMFQVATLLSVAKHKKTIPLLPLNSKTKVFQAFNLECEHLNNENIRYISQIYQEPSFHFNDEIFNIPDNCDIRGYFQSEKYFIDFREEIEKQFIFKEEIMDKATKKVRDYPEERVGIHVRRGDYIKLFETHPPCSVDYYKRSMNFMREKIDNPFFLIFSDDAAWCKENFMDEDCKVLKNSSPEIDMCAMSLCDHQIIANSSFSWWPAWLNKNEKKIIIAPELWFGNKGPTDTEDLLPSTWMKF